MSRADCRLSGGIQEDGLQDQKQDSGRKSYVPRCARNSSSTWSKQQQKIIRQFHEHFHCAHFNCLTAKTTKTNTQIFKQTIKQIKTGETFKKLWKLRSDHATKQGVEKDKCEFLLKYSKNK